MGDHMHRTNSRIVPTQGWAEWMIRFEAGEQTEELKRIE